MFNKGQLAGLMKQAQAMQDNLKKAQDELAIGIFVDTILQDWKGVSARDGSELPYSKENAKALLLDLPNLFGTLQAEANKMSNFTQASLELAAKN